MALFDAYSKAIKKLSNKYESDLSIIKKEDYVCPVCEHYHLGIVEYEECEYCGMPKKHIANKRVRKFLQTGLYPLKIQEQDNKRIIFLNKKDFTFNYDALLKEIGSSDFKELVITFNPLSIFLLSLIVAIITLRIFMLSFSLELSIYLSVSISTIIGLIIYRISSDGYIVRHLKKHYRKGLDTIGESRMLLNEIRGILLKDINKNTRYIQDTNKFKKNLSYFQQMAESYYKNRLVLLSRYDIYTLDIFAININRLDNYMVNNLTFSSSDYTGFVEQWVKREIKKIKNFKSFVSFVNSGKRFGNSPFLENVNNNGYVEIIETINSLNSFNFYQEDFKEIKIKATRIQVICHQKEVSLSKLEEQTSKITPYLKKSWLTTREKEELQSLQEEKEIIIAKIDRITLRFREVFLDILELLPSYKFVPILKKDAQNLKDREYGRLLTELDALNIDVILKNKNWHTQFTSKKIIQLYEVWVRIVNEFINRERFTKEYILAREINKHQEKINEHIKYFELRQLELIEKIEILWETFLFLKGKNTMLKNEDVNNSIEDRVSRHRFEKVKEYLKIDEAKVIEAREELSDAIKNQRIELEELLSTLKSDAEYRLAYENLTKD